MRWRSVCGEELHHNRKKEKPKNITEQFTSNPHLKLCTMISNYCNVHLVSRNVFEKRKEKLNGQEYLNNSNCKLMTSECWGSFY